MSMPSTQIAMREGYIAEDEQTKSEMLMQPITLRVSSASRSQTRSIAVMGALKRPAKPDGRVRAGKTARPAAGRRRRGRAVRGDADRRECVYFCRAVSAAVNPMSGAVALGTLLAAVTLPVVVWVVRGEAFGVLRRRRTTSPRPTADQRRPRNESTAPITTTSPMI